MKRGQNSLKNILDLLWQDWNDGKSDGDVFLYWKDRYEEEFGKYVTPALTVVEQHSSYYSEIKRKDDMELTKELLQERIDHYGAVSAAQRETGRNEMSFFYAGKQDAYINLINKLYPELEGERAFPLDEKKQKETIDYIVKLYKSSNV